MILLTNDDGADSPTLIPLARVLRRFGEVRIVAPERERSWIGKAISRFEPIRLSTSERDGFVLHRVDGTPADCVSLALHEILSAPPDLVVSGINLGLNFGTAFLWSSGTVGAAVEAALAGRPSIAFSMGIPEDAYGLSGPSRAARLARQAIESAAEAAGEIVRLIRSSGFPAGVDLFSVNMPSGVTPATERRVTRVVRARYGPLFAPDGEGRYVHRFRSYEALEEAPDGDLQVVKQGMISVSPLRLDLGAAVGRRLREPLEGR